MSEPKLTNLTDAKLLSKAKKACNPSQREYQSLRFITMELIRRFNTKRKKAVAEAKDS